jgi:NAD-dependent DNA ligase
MRSCRACATEISDAAIICEHCGAPTPAFDPHGQPYNVQFNRAGRTERDLSELLGLAKGMLADGVVTADEATYLTTWCSNHADAVGHWPANRIAERLAQCFLDGVIDDAERTDLRELLSALVGGTASMVLGYEAATALPLNDPAPVICWPDQVYVFTGRFAYGTRSTCEREVATRGGTCEPNVTKRTTFMVIGTFGSRDWKHSNYGTKIQKAVKLRDGGGLIQIVGEDHWAAALSRPMLPSEHPF